MTDNFRQGVLAGVVGGAVALTCVIGVGLRAAQAPAPQGGGPGGGGPGGPGPAAVDFNDHAGFRQIFDGTAASMANWEGASEVWKLVDGAIVAENTPEKPVGGTTFIWFKDTEIGDFELKMELKVEGGGNSGIQYRSRNVEPSANFGAGRGGAPGGGRTGAPAGAAGPVGPAAPAGPGPAAAPAGPGPTGQPGPSGPTAPASVSPSSDPCAPGARGGGGGGRAGGAPGAGAAPGAQRAGGPGGPGPLGGPYARWNLQGYQFDTDANGCSVGQLFEGGRFPGERGITTRQGQVILLREGAPAALLGTVSVDEIRSTFKRGDFNQYHIVVRGHTFAHVINGRLASVTIDDDATKRQAKGVIGVQIEGARVVAFRNVWLKKQ